MITSINVFNMLNFATYYNNRYFHPFSVNNVLCFFRKNYLDLEEINHHRQRSLGLIIRITISKSICEMNIVQCYSLTVKLFNHF